MARRPATGGLVAGSSGLSSASGTKSNQADAPPSATACALTERPISRGHEVYGGKANELTDCGDCGGRCVAKRNGVRWPRRGARLERVRKRKWALVRDVAATNWSRPWAVKAPVKFKSRWFLREWRALGASPRCMKVQLSTNTRLEQDSRNRAIVNSTVHSRSNLFLVQSVQYEPTGCDSWIRETSRRAVPCVGQKLSPCYDIKNAENELMSQSSGSLVLRAGKVSTCPFCSATAARR